MGRRPYLTAHTAVTPVDVHPLVTVLAVLVGEALLGIIGALVAIPAAVAVGLVLDEYVFPKKERQSADLVSP